VDSIGIAGCSLHAGHGSMFAEETMMLIASYHRRLKVIDNWKLSHD
jgi:hypothetical protein